MTEEYQKRLTAESSLSDLKSRELKFGSHETVIKMEDNNSSPLDDVTSKKLIAV